MYIPILYSVAQYEEEEVEDYKPVSYAELLKKKEGEVDGVSWRDLREPL